MDLLKKSIEVIKNNQSSNGAYVASSNLDVYNYSWFRDGSWIAYAMLINNEADSAKRFHNWANWIINENKDKITKAIERVKNGNDIGKDFIHPRYTVNGKESKDDWGNFQLDGLGVWLWSLSEYVKLTNDKDLIESAGLVCDYLKVLWKSPCHDLWEEKPEKLYTNTLASIYCGLSVFSSIFPEKKLDKVCLEIKDFILKNNIKGNLLVKSIDSEEIDASLIMCALPFSLFSVNDKIMKKTVSEIIKELKITSGLRRYKNDMFYGGGEWIILACLLGWYYVEVDNLIKANKIIKWVEKQVDEQGNLPEQINPINQKEYEKWIKDWGEPAHPLLWSHAMYIILNKKIKRDN